MSLFKRMVLHDATAVDGVGVPPTRPANVVVRNGRVAPLKEAADRRIAPGFIDCHAHAGDASAADGSSL